MTYTGKLFGKIGRKYIPMEHTTEYYDDIEKKIQHLKKAYEKFDESCQYGESNEYETGLLLDAVEDLVLRSKE